MSTVEIDGVLYEKNEDREGVITFSNYTAERDELNV